MKMANTDSNSFTCEHGRNSVWFLFVRYIVYNCICDGNIATWAIYSSFVRSYNNTSFFVQHGWD